MPSKAVSGMILILFFLSALAFEFKIQSVEADNSDTVDDLETAGFLEMQDALVEADSLDSSLATRYWSPQMIESFLEDRLNIQSMEKLFPLANGEWDFSNKAGLGDFACSDDNSIELVIGVNHARQNCDSKLADVARDFGGEVVNTVSISGESRAVVVDVPHEMVSTFVSEVETAGMARYIEPNLKGEVDSVPDDPDWSQQWGPRVIEADYAWNTTIGDSSVLVAVIDTGIDWDHPDLAANYVPLGYDWVNNDTDPMDDHGHGTHCAGVIAAVINNSIGIAGLAQARIMGEKVLDRTGSGSEDDIANAIIHAVDQGANILSNSWGMLGESVLIHEAVEYAHDHGVLVIASAGNDASGYEQSPATYEEVVAVTATDGSDNPAGFTNYGDWVEVAAPGVGVYSTWWNDTYARASGTSMAAPHVAGVAALIWSHFPNMSRNQVRAQLRSTAEDLGDPGFDEYYGYGRINARRAIEQSLPSHDLALLYWKTPSVLKPSHTAMVNGTLLNFGANNESNIDVQLLVNGTVAESTIASYMESGTSTTVSFTWNPPAEGKYNVTLYVKPVTGEILTKDNALSKYVIVRLSDEISVPNDFSTIQKAINEAISGYTIKVKSGIYHEHIIICKSVTIAGENPKTTIIDGNDTEKAVWIAYAHNVSVTGFTIQNSPYGLVLYASNNNNISRNTVTENSYGVEIAYSGGNTFTHNNITRNDFNLDVTGYSLSDFLNYIDASNTADGKPIYYLVNQRDLVINPTTFPEVGYLALVNSSNITVDDLNLTKNGQGILLAYTNTSTIENLNTSGNIWGFLLVKCFQNTIHRNVIIDNAYGMDLWSSDNNFIIENMIEKCFDGAYFSMCSNNVIQGNIIKLVGYRQSSWPSRWGMIFLYGSSSNTILNNELTETYMGITIGVSAFNNATDNIILNNTIGFSYSSCSNNSVVGNLITQNSVGIDLYKSNGSVIYHNVLIDNKRQVRNSKSTNDWDDGYPSGGNYWSDYAGVDLYHGPYQNETGSDGIGDTPYVVDADNQDHYPLACIAEHELVVFLDAPRIIPPSHRSMLSATVVNKGFNNETSVELLLMIDGNIINSTVIPFLQVGSAHTITHQWTPTIERTYNITASATRVPNEKFTENNVATKIVTVSTGTSINVHPSEITIGLGKTLRVNISVTAVEDLFTWQVTVHFDPTVYNCTNVFFPSNHIFADEQPVCLYFINYTGNYVRAGATLLGTTPGFNGSGILCQIEIKAVGQGTSDFAFGQYGEATFFLNTELELIQDVMVLDGTVEVEPIPGDLNKDGKVDMRDIGLAGSAFGSYPGHPRWNPQADVNQDDKVDIGDIAKIAKHFGETA